MNYPWQHCYSSFGLEHPYQMVRDDNRWLKVCKVPEHERTKPVHDRKDSETVFVVPLFMWNASWLVSKHCQKLNHISAEVDPDVLIEIDLTA